MKIRIKGNSLRIRLSRSEVDKLAEEGYLEEQTCFGNNSLVYALQARQDTARLSADFIGNKITMYVPGSLVTGWPLNTVVGFDASMPLPGSGSLELLLEKDFVCTHASAEDQSDHFENPGKPVDHA